MVGKATKMHIFAILIVLLSLFVTFVPEFNQSTLFFEILVQSRPYVAVILLLFALVLMLKRYFFLGIVQFLCVFAHVFWICGGYSSFSAEKVCSKSVNSQFIRVFSFNAYYKNEKYDEVMRAIEVADADIVFLQEVQAGLYHYGRERLSKRYAFHYSEFEQGIEHGKSIYSKYPITDVKVQELKGSTNKVLRAHITVGDRRIHFMGIHSISPKNIERAKGRDRHIEALKGYINALDIEDAPLVVAGDFNTTPWHPIMRGFREQTQLNNKGFYNIVGTWPTWLPPFLTIPIDHIFYSDDFGHSKYYRGLPTGSDHYPIYVDLEMCK